MNEAEWSTAISAVRISTDDDEESSEDDDGKVTLALFGGAYASQPAGRELLLRLARHLAEGVKRGDGEVAALLKRCRVFILPAVDAAGFDPRQEGRCERKRRSSFSPRAAKAVRQFLRSHKVDAALSLESGGLFVRMPWDDSSRMRKNSTKVRQEKTLISYFIQTIFFPQSDSTLRFLGESFLKSHSALSNSSAASAGCPSRPTGLAYGSDLNEYSGGTLLDLVRSQPGSPPAVAAHVSCCLFPRGRDLPELWRSNLRPLMAFLGAASQGIHGQVRKLAGTFFSLKMHIFSFLRENFFLKGIFHT